MIRPQKQTGYILLSVVVAITLVAAIALLMSSESALESNRAGGELDAQRARYVAEAGLNHGLWLSRQQGCGPYTDLSNMALGADEYSSNLTTDLGATTSYSITVDQDNWIDSGQPTNNFANDSRLHIQFQAGIVNRPLLRYDLSPIAANASILSATAWFYVDAAHAEGPVDIHRITADWSETDATWSSMNAKMDSGVLASIPIQPTNQVWVPVNLTSQVQAWANGQPNYGITLNTSSEGIHAEYHSRESANSPYLEIVVGTAPTSPAVLNAVGTVASGINRSITRTDVRLRQHPQAYHHAQLGPDDIDDAWITGTKTDWNYGGHTILNVNEGGGPQRGLIRFDPISVLPQGAVLTSATLELFASSAGGSGFVRLYGLKQDWVEGACTGAGGCSGAVTWDTTNGSNAWNTPGGYADFQPLAEIQAGNSSVWYSWDITSIAREWVVGTRANHGLLLKGESADLVFHSGDHADATTHPKITLGYTCTCGEVCVAPQGAGRIVMIGDYVGPAPDPRDEEKEEIFESWGFDVDIADDNFIWAINFNNYDVVYVSETASSAAVTGQLSWRSIGIVNEQGNLNYDLGFSTTRGTLVGDAVDIVDSDHYITAPFALGPLPIYSADMEIITATGSKAPGLHTLAEAGGADSLMLLDAGATTLNGAAPGRRVGLPLGRVTNSNFDWTYLNSNGRLLVQRALTWGAGLEPAVTGPPLLLVVVNPANLTTQESAKKALFESWGYKVNLIDASDSQADFDAALAENNVVYITEDVNSGNVNTKLVDATIGVVTEEDNLSDEFGFSNSIHWGSGSALNINNSHYITQPLAEGMVTLLTVAESLADLTGTLAPDLEVLGVSTDGPALAAIDAGDSLILGGVAAGRRVILPWGGSDFDVNHLNDDGLTILRRSLEWAAGAGASGYAGPVAHWKLDETSGVTAVDSVGGNDGTLVNGPVWAPGKLNGGLSFDGINDYIDVSSMNPLSYDDLTIVAWYRSADTSVSDDEYIFEHIDFPVDEISFAATDDGGDRLRFGFTVGGTWFPHYGTSDIVDQQWHHLVAVRSGGRVKLYVDGIKETDEVDNFAGVTVSVDGDGPFIGDYPGQTEQVHGTLDDVRFYDRGLDDAEIAALFAGGAGSGTLDIKVADGDDDAEQLISDGTMELISTDLELADNLAASGQPTDIVGIRFVNVSVPQGDSIDSAYIQFQVDELDGGAASLTIEAEAVDDATQFTTTNYDITSRPRSAASVLWAPPVWTTVGERGPDQRTVDISPLIQEIVNRPGWSSGNAIVLIVSGSGTRTAEAYDGDPAGAPELHIEYGGGGGGGGTGYTELHQPWSASNDDTWETVSLASFGVPSNAVVEVALENSQSSGEHEAGVRAVGSSLERRFLLHEPESGGVDVVTLHVQTDSSSQIQHYADSAGFVTFRLLGYWTGASYVELFDNFSLDDDDGWSTHDFTGEGVADNAVAEIVLVNTSTSRQSLAGIRATGSGIQRRFNLHEAESGGIDAVSIFVQTDASARAETYGPDEDGVEIHVVGYWSTAPGTYVETGGSSGQVSASSTWQTIDLSGFGVPADSIAQIVMSNQRNSNENRMGLRAVGSTLNDRFFDLQEAESGGDDFGSMHVNVDGSAQLQWYAEYGASGGYFFPVGWWVLSP